ncbi:MAG: Penicillin-binding protein beta-lactamase class [Pseudarthrobacter sp.]|nr:Penicillin-binding protein beta-lactamase class [Pseudarthrobacter sp.]
MPTTGPLPSLEESLIGESGGVDARSRSDDVRITMEPGQQFRYSNVGFTVLQLVIEEITGEDFSAYMQREVLDPLGMSRSTFQWREAMQDSTAIGYDDAGQPMPNSLFTERAAGGLYSTAPDMARFMAAGMAGPDGEAPGRGVGVIMQARGAWLGTGPSNLGLMLAEDLEFTATTFLVVGGLLAAGALAWGVYLIRGLFLARRSWLWRPVSSRGILSWLGRAGALTLIVTAAVTWWMAPWRDLTASYLPTETHLLTAALMLSCLAGAATVLTRRAGTLSLP